MQIQYRETTSDLLTRIDIHKKYGGRDIDQWMLATLQLQRAPKGGSASWMWAVARAKQCFVFHKALEGQCEITGGDVNAELLAQARAENAKIGSPVTFKELDFNQRFPFEDNQFDLASCCFAIYYARDIPFTIREMQRVIRPGGRLFTSGPMPDNKKLFYDVIREATHNKPIPPCRAAPATAARSWRQSRLPLPAWRCTFSRIRSPSTRSSRSWPTRAPRSTRTARSGAASSMKKTPSRA